MSWTDERIAELTRLWQAGHSASEIGKRLGVSKNAVVGKAHRLKLPGRPSPIKHTEAPRTQPPKRKQAAAKPRVQAPPPRARVEDGRGGPGCLWPIGDPGDTDFHFCGEQVVPGKPYCADHAARAYITRSRDRSDEAA
jgi:GcrA cell cycle regulator